jgi:uncharacterized Zn-binding protein involved in type VI secretion
VEKRAARVGDPTIHKGTIMPPGCPTVLIGGMPAARVGDFHMCPTVTGTVPHVGGAILPGPGSPSVLIGGVPAARVGDKLLCMGPLDTVDPNGGCSTVLIGDAL